MRHRPPRIPEFLLSWALHTTEEGAVLGDLEETWLAIAAEYGSRRADAWYWRQVLTSLPTFLSRSCYWGIVMLRNYLLIAFRNLRKQLGYSSINVLGLAVGMGCVIVAMLYFRHELSFDRYHDKANRIVRLVKHSTSGEGTSSSPVVSGVFGPMLAESFEHIESFVRLRYARTGTQVQIEDQTWIDEAFFYADASILSVFDIEPVTPLGMEALAAPGSVILSESAAQRYFAGESSVGKLLRVGEEDLTVTGMYRDFPVHSHFRPSMLASFATLERRIPEVIAHPGNNFFLTYFLLGRPDGAAAVEEALPALIRSQVGPEAANRLAFELQPLTDIHLFSHYEGEIQAGGSINNLIIFGAIASIILIIALINFMNLSTARSFRRAREVGVRKALGAHRTQITAQFLGETLVLAFMALVCSAGIVLLLLPLGESVAAVSLPARDLIHPVVGLALIGFTAAVGLAAGMYPALVISGFRTVSALKGTSSAGGRRGNLALRRFLVAFQFAASIVLLVGAFTVRNQLDYLRSRPLGFDDEQVVTTRFRTTEARAATAGLKEDWKRIPGVVDIGGSSHLLGSAPGGILFQPEGAGSPEDGLAIATMHIDSDFLRTLNIELVAGPGFDPARPTDLQDGFLINEQTAQALGWTPEEAIGKSWIWPSSLTGATPPVVEGRVVGVVRDFHFESLHGEIAPLVLAPADGPTQFLNVRVSTGDITQTLQDMESALKARLDGVPFEFVFLDAHFDGLYRAEARFGGLFTWFAAIAVFLACLGVLGMISYTAEQRTREIGIRKVLGATRSHIIGLLSRDFTMLVGVAFLIGAPVGFFLMNRWLDNFAYRIGLDPMPFLLSGATILSVAWLTVAYHTIRASGMRPVSALRRD